MKEVVYWTAQAWNDIKSTTLQKRWNKLLVPEKESISSLSGSNPAINGSTAKSSSSADGLPGNTGDALMTNNNISTSACIPTLSRDGSLQDFMEDFSAHGIPVRCWQTPQTWLEEDCLDPGYQLMTDAEIVDEALCNNDHVESDCYDEIA